MSISQRDRKLMALVIAEMERLEGQQLNFGINNTRITVDFLTRSLSSDFTSRSLSSDLTPPTAAEVQAALDYQMKQGEIIEVEQGVYRSRIAETARCIRLVRQRFFDRSNQPRRIVDSMELVEAIRTEFRQRTRPNRRQVSIEELLDTGGVELDSKLKDSLRWAIEEGLGWKGAAAFQSRAFRSIYALSQRSNAADEAIVVAGDTGSGKTEAFLFPILARIAQEKKNLEDSHIHSGVGAVLVYPRIRLALNQLERIARILKLWELYGGPRLTIGIQNAHVPTLSNDQYNKSWNSARERYGAKIPDRAVVMDLMPCPFEPSPDVLAQLAQENLIEEGSQLVFEDIGEVQAANSDFPRLVSKEPRYWKPQSEGERTAHQEKLNNGVFDQLLVTKSALKRGRDDLRLIPDILIITNKSLSQYLLQPEFQHLWGLWSNEGGHKVAPPRFLVLDEIHLLSGLEGAHLSRLISRFQARVSLAAKELGMGTRYALPIGVSATLYDEAGFMAKILGIDPDEASSKITVRKPEDTDSIEKELADTEGRERYIFVRPHEIPNPEEPERRVGSMAAAIQIVMASMHNLMSRAEGRNLQYKGLAFFDSVNDVNLFEQFYNSRGSNSDLIQQGANTMRLWSIRTMHTCPLTKTSCKFSNLRGGEQVFYNSCPIFLAGDCWVFAEKWGWDDLLKVSRANYSGVYTDIQKSQLIPTTPVLEVGYDDDAIQFVYQHMAPNNVASFIQRRGRAGRNPEQSPVIVTLLWPYRSRDLFYFYRPNYLYEPSFDDIPLNSRNRHVQLTHAFLAIFDWLAIRQATVGWIGAPGEELSILSANYTTIGGESGSIPKSSGGYYKRRWELRQQRLTGWGSTILIRAEQEIQRYL
ncbi:MAG TPA: DEAD/DEAH box helicase, partial [Ktedonobacteraceae bacterium]|nr:DEAD/DEAH box helicase [Ktedonobacteraceae bacterium]